MRGPRVVVEDGRARIEWPAERGMFLRSASAIEENSVWAAAVEEREREIARLRARLDDEAAEHEQDRERLAALYREEHEVTVPAMRAEVARLRAEIDGHAEREDALRDALASERRAAIDMSRREQRQRAKIARLRAVEQAARAFLERFCISAPTMPPLIWDARDALSAALAQVEGPAPQEGGR